MEHDGWSIMDRCCDLCTHSVETPCRNYVVCRIEGPLCHDDRDCKERRMRRIYEVRNGRSGVKISIGMGSCGLAVGARDVYHAALKYIEKRG